MRSTLSCALCCIAAAVRAIPGAALGSTIVHTRPLRIRSSLSASRYIMPYETRIRPVINHTHETRTQIAVDCRLCCGLLSTLSNRVLATVSGTQAIWETNTPHGSNSSRVEHLPTRLRTKQWIKLHTSIRIGYLIRNTSLFLFNSCTCILWGTNTSSAFVFHRNYSSVLYTPHAHKIRGLQERYRLLW